MDINKRNLTVGQKPGFYIYIFVDLSITSGTNATLISVGDELLVTINGLQSNLIDSGDFSQLS